MNGCSRCGASTASSGACSGATRARRSSTSCCRCCSSPLVGAILSGNQHELNRLVAVDRRDERDVDDLHRARLQHGVPARAWRAEADPRHAAAERISYFAGWPLNAVTNTALQIAIVVAGGRVFFGLGWPLDWLQLVVFVLAGVVSFALLGVAFSHAIPNFESTAAFVNAVFVPVVFVSFYVFDARNAPGFLRDIAKALPLKPLIGGLSGGIVTSTSLSGHLDALGRDRPVGELRRSTSRCGASRGSGSEPERRSPLDLPRRRRAVPADRAGARAMGPEGSARRRTGGADRDSVRAPRTRARDAGRPLRRRAAASDPVRAADRRRAHAEARASGAGARRGAACRDRRGAPRADLPGQRAARPGARRGPPGPIGGSARDGEDARSRGGQAGALRAERRGGWHELRGERDGDALAR